MVFCGVDRSLYTMFHQSALAISHFTLYLCWCCASSVECIRIVLCCAIGFSHKNNNKANDSRRSSNNKYETRCDGLFLFIVFPLNSRTLYTKISASRFIATFCYYIISAAENCPNEYSSDSHPFPVDSDYDVDGRQAASSVDGRQWQRQNGKYTRIHTHTHVRMQRMKIERKKRERERVSVVVYKEYFCWTSNT